ncbi:RCC1/BLIP-II [Stereum hirsutum FP-91666 SS1]|uniref:RCC1/BLIP-II n=1 Tax=Stereum hirsutum (strain FP-91666) TaxID=721885 RepID=UPI000440B54F|nr:RCC1/BLIP-II [Stereum hirsutum FP-91666 SS1]EIM88036.1 RCC1/BLIP-II [Stereum hirsutum FP-91666 SS1]
MLLYAAGSNGQGQLANGTRDDAHTFTLCSFTGYPAGELPPSTTCIHSIANGGNHTLVLLSRLGVSSEYLELWGSGDGSKGQLGPGVTELHTFNRIHLPLEEHGLTDYTVARVGASWETSFVVLVKDGESDILISLGGNDFGDLGVGTANVQPAPFYVVSLSHIVDPQHRISILDLATGPHNIILHVRESSEDGRQTDHIIGWGKSRHGQLGAIPPLSTGRPVPYLTLPHALSLDFDPSHVRAIALGHQHSVFLHSDGSLYGLGSDQKGQLRGLPSVRRATSVGCTWNGTYVLVSEGDNRSMLLSSGSSTKGQLGRTAALDDAGMKTVQFPFTLFTDRVEGLAYGSEHLLVLLSGDPTSTPRTGEVWGWGWNEHGNLGTGSLEDVHTPRKVWPPSSPGIHGRALGVWAGCGTSWIAVADDDDTR